ncbi:[bacterium]|nr:[FeFe] hydrogenase H-cluster maturation GTPase HydF [bacterium]
MQITKSERPHIAFFGCTNAGKSSVVNAVTNQALSVVSDIKGTTTDPVQKAMELLPIGPVVIIDTAGLDDGGKLGELRIEKTMQVLGKTDIAVLIVDSTIGINEYDKKIIQLFEERKLPYVVVYNKSDLINKSYLPPNPLPQGAGELAVSAVTGEGINELRELLSKIASENKVEKYIIKDRLKAGDIVILVIPIDESAPKGRIILPQQNVLRECLDAHATAICCQIQELKIILNTYTPKYVITDSQAFNKVKDIVPENIILSSFSILMAQYKGNLNKLLEGAKTISKLQDGDKILISEACSHHRQCNDIGTVKFPMWIKNYTGKNIDFEFTQGGEFPLDLSKYKLIIHCGGCMINEAEMKNRVKRASEQNIPIVNYGMAIAYMNGILERALRIFENE